MRSAAGGEFQNNDIEFRKIFFTFAIWPWQTLRFHFANPRIIRRNKHNVKNLLTAFMLPLLLLFGSQTTAPRTSQAAKTSLAEQSESGTLQKMIVASGSVSMDMDLNRINGVGSTTRKLETLRFGVAPTSFFPCLSLTKCCAEQSQARWRWCRKITSRFLQY